MTSLYFVAILMLLSMIVVCFRASSPPHMLRLNDFKDHRNWIVFSDLTIRPYQDVSRSYMHMKRLHGERLPSFGSDHTLGDVWALEKALKKLDFICKDALYVGIPVNFIVAGNHTMTDAKIELGSTAKHALKRRLPGEEKYETIEFHNKIGVSWIDPYTHEQKTEMFRDRQLVDCLQGLLL